MKICPTCKETYSHDDLVFCLKDGETLKRADRGKDDLISRIKRSIKVRAKHKPVAKEGYADSLERARKEAISAEEAKECLLKNASNM